MRLAPQLGQKPLHLQEKASSSSDLQCGHRTRAKHGEPPSQGHDPRHRQQQEGDGLRGREWNGPALIALGAERDSRSDQQRPEALGARFRFSLRIDYQASDLW